MSDSISSGGGLASLTAGAIHDGTAMSVISKTLGKVQEAQVQGQAVQQTSEQAMRISAQQANGLGTRLNTVA